MIYSSYTVTKPKSKFRLMCEGEYININPCAMSLPQWVSRINEGGTQSHTIYMVNRWVDLLKRVE